MGTQNTAVKVQLGELSLHDVDKSGPTNCEEFIYVDIGSVDRETKKIVDAKYLPVAEAPSRAKQILRTGDVIVSMTRPNLNAVAKVTAALDGAIGSTGFHVIRSEYIEPGLAYYLVQTREFVEAMCKCVQGALYPAVRPSDISSFEFLLPPIAEQQRIVAKLEQLFSELDKGVENLRSAQQQLKVYRQALINDVLKAKNHRDSLTVPLSDLIGRINQGWSPKCELNRQALDSEWAIIKTTAVQSMQYSQEECKPLPENFEPRPEIEIKVGDFLMTRKGPRNRTGVVCLVEATRSKSMLCDTVYRFRCDEARVYPKYLELVLNSPTVVAELDRRKSGISDSGISLNHPKLKTLPIPLVGTIAAQKSIVDEVELKLGKITTLEIEVSQSLLKAEALRQSILKKAFSGQLVAQDPNDEPASVLLERIRAERAAQPKARGRKARVSA